MEGMGGVEEEQKGPELASSLVGNIYDKWVLITIFCIDIVPTLTKPFFVSLNIYFLLLFQMVNSKVLIFFCVGTGSVFEKLFKT